MDTPQGPAPAAPALVGRDRELAALRDALTAALSGRGSLVLIGGEAGIGKTALAEVLLAAARKQGTLVLVGRCYDLSETPPYGPGPRPSLAYHRSAMAYLCWPFSPSMSKSWHSRIWTASKSLRIE